jgi:hypothetical protein
MLLLHRSAPGRALPRADNTTAKRRRGAWSRQRPLAPSPASPSSSSWPINLNLNAIPPPAKAAFLTGAYALVAGAALVAAPAPTLAILAPVAATAVPPGWVRLGGMILATFGAQYALAAWFDCRGGSPPSSNADAFYRASVPSRLALALALAALVASGQVERGVLILAILNATGALSMLRALRRVAAG